jgi:hypothetical protein
MGRPLSPAVSNTFTAIKRAVGKTPLGQDTRMTPVLSGNMLLRIYIFFIIEGHLTYLLRQLRLMDSSDSYMF